MRRILPLLLLSCAAQHPHAPAVLDRLDFAWPRLQAQYSADQREAVSWAATPAEAWDESAAVLDTWGPAWQATRAVVLAAEAGSDPLPAFCTARALWAERGVTVDDDGLCTLQRPCWTRPED